MEAALELLDDGVSCRYVKLELVVLLFNVFNPLPFEGMILYQVQFRLVFELELLELFFGLLALFHVLFNYLVFLLDLVSKQ